MAVVEVPDVLVYGQRQCVRPLDDDVPQGGGTLVPFVFLSLRLYLVSRIVTLDEAREPIELG